MVVPARTRSQCILVVDDHAENRMLMQHLLTRQGYEVLAAGDAEVAAEIMRQSQPDLVLLDVIMPGKSGYELCREWKDAP
jgi:chemotaxis family two-component system response regulator PixH